MNFPWSYTEVFMGSEWPVGPVGGPTFTTPLFSVEQRSGVSGRHLRCMCLCMALLCVAKAPSSDQE